MDSLRKLAVLSCLSLAVCIVASLPADKKEEESATVSAGNLKYTFASKEEIPAAFFESAPAKSGVAVANVTAAEVRVYPACQDGSGGTCVDAGTCPSQFKPETPSGPGACADGKECCFGAPSNDKSCRTRGGQCRPSKECGSAPTAQDAEDCDKKNGEVCCILIF